MLKLVSPVFTCLHLINAFQRHGQGEEDEAPAVELQWPSVVVAAERDAECDALPSDAPLYMSGSAIGGSVLAARSPRVATHCIQSQRRPVLRAISFLKIESNIIPNSSYFFNSLSFSDTTFTTIVSSTWWTLIQLISIWLMNLSIFDLSFPLFIPLCICINMFTVVDVALFTYTSI